MKIIRHIDSKIQLYFDKVLPRNLTVRYILGLTLIAVLSLAGHVLIRVNLAEVTFDERMIRKIKDQINKSEGFYREIIYLQAVNNDAVYRDALSKLDDEVAALVKNHYLLQRDMDKLSSPNAMEAIKSRLRAQKSFEVLEESYKRISFIKLNMDTSSIELSDPLLISFISSENSYRDSLTQLNKYYEADANENIDRFKNIETLLLLLILLTLLVEGLYVFRPAVQRVYSAIQLRSDFLSKLSHEIRNPMNSILGMAQLLSKTNVNLQQAKYLKILENSGNGLLEMLNNLLDFSSLEAGKIEVESVRVDLYAVLEKSIDLVTVKIQEKNLELVIEIEKDVPLVIYSDPVKLQQVIVNLLSNAAKFTERGFVKLEVRVVTNETSNLLQISIQDSGVGIEDGKINSIFESFVQENSSIRRKYGGTGLGLSIAKEIMSLMNGQIIVKSKKGLGSNFIVSMPLILPSEIKKAKDYIPSNLLGKRFLLVDENELNVQAVFKLISDFDGECKRIKTNSSFEDILMQLKEKSFDKFLIDASTFGVNLEDLLKYLVDENVPKEKICILFRFIHTNYLFETLKKFGISQLFPKPIKPIEFVNYLSGAVLPDKSPEGYYELQEVTGHRFKILVAEDSPDNRMLIQLYLEKMPVDLYFAENGLKAVELFQQHRFDIVLMDIQMPEMDGKTAAQYIRRIERKQKLVATPILAFSAHKPSEINYEAGSGLFDDFVIKPVTSEIVKAKLSEYLKLKKPPVERELPVRSEVELDLSDLIPSYIQRRLEDLEKIEVLYDKDEYNLIARLGHQIKGTAKSYGFEEFGFLANELEQSALVSDKEKVSEILTQMKSKMKAYQKTHIH